MFYVLAASAGPLESFEQDSKLLSSPDSKAFVASLKPAVWPFRDVAKTAAIDTLHNFLTHIHSLKNSDCNLTWSVFRTSRKPVFLSFPGSDSHFAAAATNPVFLATIQSSERMHGFFAVTFLKARDGGQDAIIEYIMTSNGEDIGEEILLFLKNEFSAVFKISNLYAEMEWAGREYWARPEFGFGLSELQPQVVVNGVEIPFRRMMRGNFANFLKRHSLSAEDLIIAGGGRTFPFSWNDIQDPGDVRLVMAKDLRRISVGVLKAHGTTQHRRLHVGKAFLLANHQVEDGQVLIGGKAYSDSAMPPWFGVVSSNCENSVK